jgi:crotonobetainyl-CoA:carnitine CoA-transferase CaiB-like acyl-CoA transferase
MSWRVAHSDAVDAMLGDWTRETTTDEAVRRLTDAGVVVSAVHTIDDLLQWPHLQARGMIDTVEHPALGPLTGLKAAGFPLKFSGAETGYGGAAVPSGTHTREVLSDLLDLDAATLDDLAERSII